jgi:hydrogenase maturation factor
LTRLGKLNPDTMERVVYRSLGRPTNRMLVGPGRGLDNAVLSLGHGKVMIMTVDPVSASRSIGMKLSAWLSVHLVASDYTTSGLRPEFATFSYNFPSEMSAGEVEEYLGEVGRECKRLGVTIAGGHSGSYPGAGFTVVGAGSMLGFTTEGGYLTAAMARPGDTVLMTKHAAIEAAAWLELSFGGFAEKRVGKAMVRKAREMIRSCSTVKEAAIAAGVGLGAEGVTSMHDATEGGILGGFGEMAAASKNAFVVDRRRIPVSDEAAAVCSAFGIDPLTSLSEGALLITCSPDATDGLLKRMKRGGIKVTEVGRVKEGEGLWVASRGRASRFAPRPDGYWRAYERAAAR